MQKALADDLVQRILISLKIPAYEALALKRPRHQERRRRALIEETMRERIPSLPA